MNKKHLIAASVVLTTMFGTATAMADTTNTPATDGNVTVTTTNDTSNGVVDNNTTATNTTDNGTGSTGDVNVTTTNATGNTANGTGGVSTSFPQTYLYFVTQITQSISIALANNDTDKAKLLVEYGIANIKVANELVKEGNVDAANALLTNAVNYQDTAVDVSQQAGGSTATEVKGEVANNIVALATALQHVQNPNAQAHLEKNILKDLEHLQKKIDHIKNHKEDGEEHDSDSNNSTSGSTSTAGSTTGNTTTTVTTQSGSTSGTTNVTVGGQGTIDLSNFFGQGEHDDQGEDNHGGSGNHGDHGDHGNHGHGDH